MVMGVYVMAWRRRWGGGNRAGNFLVNFCGKNKELMVEGYSGMRLAGREGKGKHGL